MPTKQNTKTPTYSEQEEYVVKIGMNHSKFRTQQIALSDLSINSLQNIKEEGKSYVVKEKCVETQKLPIKLVSSQRLQEEDGCPMFNKTEKTISNLECFKQVTKLAVSPILSMFFQFFVQLINTYYVGQLGDPIIMAGVGMGNMMINVLCFAFTQGLNGAIETLVSQSYGYGKFEQCGVFLNRGRVIVSVIMIPMSIVFLFSDRILQSIGQNEQISTLANQYMIMLIPGVWAMTQFDATRKFMIAQRKATYPLYIQIFTMIEHLVLCSVLVKYFELGFIGTAIATNVTYILNMVIADILVFKIKDFSETRASYDISCLKEWKAYLQLGIPGAMMLCFEWWAFEFLAIFSGYMGIEQLAAEVIVINIVTFIFMMPLGIQCAASSLTGNYIGQRNIQQAKKFANFTLILDILLSIIVMIVIIGNNEWISSIFTTDEEVSSIVNNMMWIMLLYIFFDGIHGVQAGIIKGLGKQSSGSVFTLICYYCFGMPLALGFAFKMNMQVGGLWLGFSIASIVLDIGFYVIIRSTNWEKVAYLISKRIEKEEKIRMAVVNKLRTSVSSKKGDEFQKLLSQESFHSQVAFNSFSLVKKL